MTKISEMVTQEPEAPEAATVPQAFSRLPLPAEVLNRFVYLVGTPRSGTTVITRSFYLSPRVFSCPTPTRFTHRVWRHRGKVDSRLLNDIFKIPEFYRERASLRTLDPADRVRIEKRIRHAFSTKNLAELFQLYPLIYSIDPKCIHQPDQAVCWADKGNDVYGIYEIARSLPESKFVLIIRDPRATVASMRSQTVRWQGQEGSSKASMAGLIASTIYWRNMMQTFLRLNRRYPNRTMFVRYEDFVHAPEQTINQALVFATGESMPDADLQTGLAQFRHKNKHDKSAVGVTPDFGIDHRPLERWRGMLSEDEIDLVNALTWRTGRKLGYEVERPRMNLSIIRALRRIGRRKSASAAAKIAYLGMREPFTPARIPSATSGHS